MGNNFKPFQTHSKLQRFNRLNLILYFEQKKIIDVLSFREDKNVYILHNKTLIIMKVICIRHFKNNKI